MQKWRNNLETPTFEGTTQRGYAAFHHPAPLAVYRRCSDNFLHEGNFKEMFVSAVNEMVCVTKLQANQMLAILASRALAVRRRQHGGT